VFISTHFTYEVFVPGEVHKVTIGSIESHDVSRVEFEFFIS